MSFGVDCWLISNRAQEALALGVVSALRWGCCLLLLLWPSKARTFRMTYAYCGIVVLLIRVGLK
jgi:hypothetical protein